MHLIDNYTIFLFVKLCDGTKGTMDATPAIHMRNAANGGNQGTGIEKFPECLGVIWVFPGFQHFLPAICLGIAKPFQNAAVFLQFDERLNDEVKLVIPFGIYAVQHLCGDAGIRFSNVGQRHLEDFDHLEHGIKF